LVAVLDIESVSERGVDRKKGIKARGIKASRLRRIWPAAFVMAFEDAPEDVEHEVQVAGALRAVDDGESAQAEGGGDVAGVGAVGAGAFDGDDGRGLVEAGEELEEARAAFFELGLDFGVGDVEGEAHVHDGDMDGERRDDFGGLAPGAGPKGEDAHGFQEAGEAVDPGFGLPASAGEEEVEAGIEGIRARPAALGGVKGVAGMEAHVHHLWEPEATAVPGLEGQMGA
jgi:hypothetical protein